MAKGVIVDHKFHTLEEVEQLKRVRRQLMAPYLDLAKTIMDALPPDSPGAEIAENLRCLVELSSVKTLRQALMFTDWKRHRQPHIQKHARTQRKKRCR